MNTLPRQYVIRSLLNALGVVAYVMMVATIMQNGERLFGEMDSFLAPVAFLLLFTVSAAVVGSLVFGYPVVLFLVGKRCEGILSAVATMSWMIVATGIMLTVVATMK